MRKRRFCTILGMAVLATLVPVALPASATYIGGPAPASPPLSEYRVFGNHGVFIGVGSDIQGLVGAADGDWGDNGTRSIGLNGGAQISGDARAGENVWLANGAHITGTLIRKAGSQLNLGAGATVGSDEEYDSVDFPALPPETPITCPTGGPNQSFGSGATFNATPGTYGTLTMGGGVTIDLNGAGDYHFQRITTGNGVTINVTTPGTTRVFVCDNAQFGANAKVLPTTLDPDDFLFEAQAAGASNTSTYAWSAGRGAAWIGRVFTPNGRIRIGSGSCCSSFIGNLVGQFVNIAHGVNGGGPECVPETPDPTGATANGSAFNIYVNVPVLGIEGQYPDPATSSSAGPGVDGPNNASNTLLPVNIPGVVTANVLNTSNSAEVTPTQAHDRAESSVAEVNVLDGTISAAAVKSVADATATAFDATATTEGSVIEGLFIAGVGNIDEITHDMTIVVPGVGTLEIYEREILTHESNDTNDFNTADATVNMLHLTVELGPLTGTEVIISNSDAHARFGVAFDCPQAEFAVSGDSEVLRVFLEGEPGSVLVDFVKAGPIPAAGGSDHAELKHIGPIPVENPPLLVESGTAFAHSEGGWDGDSAEAMSVAGIESLQLLQAAMMPPLLNVNLVTAEATSSATPDGNGSSTGSTTLVGLEIAGTNVCNELGLGDTCMPPPNTDACAALSLTPLCDALGLTLILNEQFGTTNPSNPTEITVNAIHLTLEGEPGVLDIIIGHAHSDACAAPLGSDRCQGGIAPVNGANGAAVASSSVGTASAPTEPSDEPAGPIGSILGRIEELL